MGVDDLKDREGIKEYVLEWLAGEPSGDTQPRYTDLEWAEKRVDAILDALHGPSGSGEGKEALVEPDEAGEDF